MKTSIPVLMPLGRTVRPEKMPSGEDNGGASSDLCGVWHCGVLGGMTIGDLGFCIADLSPLAAAC